MLSTNSDQLDLSLLLCVKQNSINSRIVCKTLTFVCIDYKKGKEINIKQHSSFQNVITSATKAIICNTKCEGK